MPCFLRLYCAASPPLRDQRRYQENGDFTMPSAEVEAALSCTISRVHSFSPMVVVVPTTREDNNSTASPLPLPSSFSSLKSEGRETSLSILSTTLLHSSPASSFLSTAFLNCCVPRQKVQESYGNAWRVLQAGRSKFRL